MNSMKLDLTKEEIQAALEILEMSENESIESVIEKLKEVDLHEEYEITGEFYY